METDTPAVEKQSSSMMHEPEYNPETKTLTIRFRHGAAVHQYADFSQEDFNEFYGSVSWGKHFQKHIRPRYEGKETRVSSSPEPAVEPS